MTPRQATVLVSRKIDALKALIDADLKDVFLWHGSTLGELRIALAGASNAYISDFTKEWKELDPDRTWYDYAAELAEQRSREGRYDEYDYDYEPPPDGWWQNTGRMMLLLGRKDLEGVSENVKVRYRWASSIFDLLQRVLNANAQITGAKGQRTTLDAPPTASAPRFEAIASEGDTGRMIARVMRTRWNAAEDLQLRGFFADACVLYGSLFEAVLVSYLEQTVSDDLKLKYGKAKGGEDVPVRRWSKDSLFKAAEETSGLHSIVSNLRPSIANFRDLIHIHSDAGVKGLHRQADEPSARILRESLLMLFKRCEESLKIPRSNY